MSDHDPAVVAAAMSAMEQLRLLSFAARHRHTVAGLRSLLGHPPLRSFAAADFHGVHAYHLVDAEQEAALWPPRFLEEMRRRVARSPVRWEPDDRCWPSVRRPTPHTHARRSPCPT